MKTNVNNHKDSENMEIILWYHEEVLAAFCFAIYDGSVNMQICSFLSFMSYCFSRKRDCKSGINQYVSIHLLYGQTYVHT